MENQGIEYRERSPLVVPPKLDLPPPAGTTAEVKAPNWPKDPDDARRKAAIAARKKANKDPREAAPASDAERTQRRKRREILAAAIRSTSPAAILAPMPS